MWQKLFHYYNSQARHISVADCKRLNDMIVGDADKQNKRDNRDKLNEIEAAMDKRVTDIALTVSDMFKFMAMSAAMLPNMELDTGIMRMKVDDGGVFFEINAPSRKRIILIIIGKEPGVNVSVMEVFSYGNPKASAILPQMVDDHNLSAIENEVEEIRKRTSTDFRLLAVKVKNWNHDLSPWKAPSFKAILSCIAVTIAEIGCLGLCKQAAKEALA